MLEENSSHAIMEAWDEDCPWGNCKSPTIPKSGVMETIFSPKYFISND